MRSSSPWDCGAGIVPAPLYHSMREDRIVCVVVVVGFFSIVFLAALLIEWMLPEPKIDENQFKQVFPNYRHSDGTINTFPSCYNSVGDCSDCGEVD